MAPKWSTVQLLANNQDTTFQYKSDGNSESSQTQERKSSYISGEIPSDKRFSIARKKMDRDKDKAEKRKLVQNAFRFGLMALPLFLYGKYVYKTFRPCPRVKSYEEICRKTLRDAYYSRKQKVLELLSSKFCRDGRTDNRMFQREVRFDQCEWNDGFVPTNQHLRKSEDFRNETSTNRSLRTGAKQQLQDNKNERVRKKGTKDACEDRKGKNTFYIQAGENEKPQRREKITARISKSSEEKRSSSTSKQRKEKSKLTNCDEANEKDLHIDDLDTEKCTSNILKSMEFQPDSSSSRKNKCEQQPKERKSLFKPKASKTKQEKESKLKAKKQERESHQVLKQGKQDKFSKKFQQRKGKKDTKKSTSEKGSPDENGQLYIPPEVLDQLSKAYYKSYKQLQEASGSQKSLEELSSQIDKSSTKPVESCDASFYSKDPDTPFIVKDYKCKSDQDNENVTSAKGGAPWGARKHQCTSEPGSDTGELKPVNEPFNIEAELEKECETKGKQHINKIENDVQQGKAKVEDDPCYGIIDEMKANEEIDTDKYDTDSGKSLVKHKKPQSALVTSEYAVAIRDEFWHSGEPPNLLRKGCQHSKKNNDEDC